MEGLSDGGLRQAAEMLSGLLSGENVTAGDRGSNEELGIRNEELKAGNVTAGDGGSNEKLGIRNEELKAGNVTGGDRGKSTGANGSAGLDAAALLPALKPFLSKGRQKKVDSALKLLNTLSVLKSLKAMGLLDGLFGGDEQ